jgi:hypothetical protein
MRAAGITSMNIMLLDEFQRICCLTNLRTINVLGFGKEGGKEGMD